jgi:general secretion pathway protein F
VVLFLLTFVLPRFAGVLEGVGTELPWASRQLISLGHVAGEHPLVLTIAIIVSVLALIGAARSPAVLRLASALAWRSPWLGTHLYAIALARLYRTLGMLTCAGIPVLQALGIARGTLSPHLQPAIQDVELHVSQGRRLSESLQLQGLTTPVSRRMIEVGERSGSLPTMLGRAASFHDEEIARFIDFVTRIVNPTLMLVMGVVIGGIVVLMYLPIFQLVEQVQ